MNLSYNTVFLHNNIISLPCFPAKEQKPKAKSVMEATIGMTNPRITEIFLLPKKITKTRHPRNQNNFRENCILITRKIIYYNCILLKHQIILESPKKT